MVICPRCQQPVDETVRATCPLCFTPIPQGQATPPGSAPAFAPPQPLASPASSQMPNLSGAPPQNASPSMPVQMPVSAPAPPRPTAMSAGARISLTGEVIDPGEPVGPPPSYVGGAVPGASQRPGPPTVQSRVPSNIRRPEAAAPEKSGGNAVGIVLALVVVLGGGAGGWYWWMHRTNPRDQAEAVYKAMVSENWETAYPLVLLSEEDKKKTPDAKTFAQQAKSATQLLRQIPNGTKILDDLKSSAKAGEPVITGDKAEVPTSASISSPFGNITFHGKAHMVNDGGIWKLDLTSRSAQATQDLIGKPELPAGTSGFKGM